MNVYHLNQFNNTVSKHYDSIGIPPLRSLKDRLINEDVTLFQLNNILLYGHDTSLCKTHMYEILRWGLKREKFNLINNTVTFSGVDISYSSTDHFIQINFDTHLNKEKNAFVDFIKQLSFQKNVIQNKHIFVLWNIEKLNHHSQFRLRRIIENTQTTTLFICFISQCSQMIDPLKSRFMMFRVPCLSTSQKRHLFISLNGDEVDQTVLKKVDTHCTNLEDVFICHQIYLINHETFSKDLKSFAIIENELNLLFKSFPKLKNVYSLIEKNRSVIYKLIHYNIQHTLITKHILQVITKLKLTDNKMHSVCNLLAKFEHDISFLNVCKIIHAYEYLFIELYKIISNESG